MSLFSKELIINFLYNLTLIKLLNIMVLCLNALGKYRLGPHPFKSQNLKAPMHVKLQKPMPKSCFYCQSPKIKVLSKQRTILGQVLWGA